MGWWETEVSEKKLIIGDEPLDLAHDLLSKITQSYQEDLDRKPLLEEVLMVVELAFRFHLDEYVSDCEDKELVAIRAKTKKRSKHQSYKVGDIFAIPLKEFGYGFGKILQASPPEILIGFFAVYSDQFLSSQELKKYPYVRKVFCGDLGLINWEWKVISHAPLEPEETQVPDFYWIDSLNPNHIEIIKGGQWDKRVKASQEDIQGLEQFGVSGYKAAEYKLAEVLQRLKS